MGRGGRAFAVFLAWLAAAFAPTACGGSGDEAATREAKCELLDELKVATPRADREAEWLALTITSAAAAPDDLYDRVARDLASIRARSTDAAGIHARIHPAIDGPFRLRVDDATIQSIRAGAYREWDCINARFGITSWAESASWSQLMPYVVELQLGGRRLNRRRLEAAYFELAGSFHETVDGRFIGEDSDVCVFDDVSSLTYIFKRGGGDCPSGCTELQYYGFTTASDGTTEVLGSFETTPGGTGRPEWLVDRMCR